MSVPITTINDARFGEGDDHILSIDWGERWQNQVLQTWIMPNHLLILLISGVTCDGSCCVFLRYWLTATFVFVLTATEDQ
jgi:hypothetical protein